MSNFLALNFDAETLKALTMGLSITRVAGTAAGAVGTLALYFILISG